MVSRKYFIYGITALIGAIVGFFLFGDLSHNPKLSQQHKNYFITNLSHLKKNYNDFTLIQHNGSQFQFSSLNGKPSLLYFGFTHCPDFCPTSLQIMDLVAQKIDVNRLFISVDPDRDTQLVLKDYVSLYKQGLIGLTGTDKMLDKVTKNWNIYYSLNKKNDTDHDYIVDHSTYLYLTDKTGRIYALIRPEASADDIVKFMQENL